MQARGWKVKNCLLHHTQMHLCLSYLPTAFREKCWFGLTFCRGFTLQPAGSQAGGAAEERARGEVTHGMREGKEKEGARPFQATCQWPASHQAVLPNTSYATNSSTERFTDEYHAAMINHLAKASPMNVWAFGETPTHKPQQLISNTLGTDIYLPRNLHLEIFTTKECYIWKGLKI